MELLRVKKKLRKRTSTRGRSAQELQVQIRHHNLHNAIRTDDRMIEPGEKRKVSRGRGGWKHWKPRAACRVGFSSTAAKAFFCLKHSSIVLGVPRRISHHRCAGVQAIWNHRGPTGLIARLARLPVWSDCLPVACPSMSDCLVARLARLPVWSNCLVRPNVLRHT